MILSLSKPSKIPPHLVYASPVTRPLATYPTNYDSPKKRIYEQTPEYVFRKNLTNEEGLNLFLFCRKFGDSYKKIKFDNSPRRGRSFFQCFRLI